MGSLDALLDSLEGADLTCDAWAESAYSSPKAQRLWDQPLEGPAARPLWEFTSPGHDARSADGRSPCIPSSSRPGQRQCCGKPRRGLATHQRPRSGRSGPASPAERRAERTWYTSSRGCAHWSSTQVSSLACCCPACYPVPYSLAPLWRRGVAARELCAALGAEWGSAGLHCNISGESANLLTLCRDS